MIPSFSHLTDHNVQSSQEVPTASASHQLEGRQVVISENSQDKIRKMQERCPMLGEHSSQHSFLLSTERR